MDRREVIRSKTIEDLQTTRREAGRRFRLRADTVTGIVRNETADDGT
jgi:hypothetical protein